MICKNCGSELIDGSKYCGECGAEVEMIRTCPHCGAELREEALFCGECGKPVRKQKDTGSKPYDEIDNRPDPDSKMVEKTPNDSSTIIVSKKTVIIALVVAAVVVMAAIALLSGRGNNDEDTTATYSEDNVVVDDMENTTEAKSGVVIGKGNQKFVQTGDASVIKVTESGFLYEAEWDSIRCGFIMENVSSKDYNDAGTIRVTIKDKDGKVLSAEEIFDSATLKKGAKVGRVGWFTVKGEPDIIEYQIISRDADTIMTESDNLDVENINASAPDEYGETIVAGEIVNPGKKKYEWADVHVIFRDADNNIIGGELSSADSIDKGKTPFSVDTNVPSGYDHCEVYAAGCN